MHHHAQLTEFAADLRDWFRRSVREGDPDSLPFENLALRLSRLQFNHNDAYRRICLARGVLPDRADSLAEIPTVPAPVFKELELTSLAPAERVATFHSSGTTGRTPSRHFHSHESLALYEASLAAWFQPHLLPGWFARHDFASFLALTPSPAEVPESSLVHMFATVQRDFGRGAAVFTGRSEHDRSWSLDYEDAVTNLCARGERSEPVVILGTAFSFVHLVDELASRGVRVPLPAGSRVLETGGYKGRSRELSRAGLHAAITAAFGVPASHIVCEYGMSELSSQAYAIGPIQDAESGARTFQFPPWARALVISPETGREVAEGESGLLRVLDLANVWSVMAVQTEDLAVRRGQGFELLGRARAAEPRGCSLLATA